MDLIIQEKLLKDSKMSELLRLNSYWFKELNRNSDSYSLFVNAMKDKYHLKVSDKISNAIDNIDLVSTLLENLK